MGDPSDEDDGGDKREIFFPGLIQLEGDAVSGEEWYELRETSFKILLERTKIPRALIAALNEFRYRAPVAWLDQDGNALLHPEEISAEVGPVVAPPKTMTEEELVAFLLDSRERMHRSLRPELPSRVDEVLSSYLRRELAAVRNARRAVRDRKSSETPIRDQEMLPPSAIATVALDMIDACETWEYPPGPQLTALLRELLEADGAPRTADKDYPARYRATWILAQTEMSVQKLARAVGVAPSTVSRWLKDPSFRAQVERDREYAERSKRGETGFDTWKPKA